MIIGVNSWSFLHKKAVRGRSYDYAQCIFYGEIVRVIPEFSLSSLFILSYHAYYVCIYEPRCEKTGLRGFRPGPIHTRLYSHRRWLEA